MTGAPSWDGAFAGRLVPGERPALLLVDPVKAYVEDGSPLYLDTGEAAIDGMARLLGLFRQHAAPIAFTNVQYRADGSDGGQFYRKVPALKVFAGESPLGAFPDALMPTSQEPVFTKQYPSAFFGTDLNRWLAERDVDTLFLCGFSTSGCVRASALDALQNGYAPFVVADACADRDDAVSDANLFDLQAKYAEVIDVATAREMLERSAGT